MRRLILVLKSLLTTYSLLRGLLRRWEFILSRLLLVFMDQAWSVNSFIWILFKLLEVIPELVLTIWWIWILIVVATLIFVRFIGLRGKMLGLFLIVRIWTWKVNISSPKLVIALIWVGLRGILMTLIIRKLGIAIEIWSIKLLVVIWIFHCILHAIKVLILGVWVAYFHIKITMTRVIFGWKDGLPLELVDRTL